MELFKKVKGKTKQKGKTKSKTGKKTKKRNSNSSSSSSSQSKRSNANNNIDFDYLESKFLMMGSVVKKPPNPPNLAGQLMEAEYKDMFQCSVKLDNADYAILDEYLRKKAELKPQEHIVIAEKIQDDEKKTSRLRVIAKYDEGRFGAIYVVRNESTVDDNVISAANNLYIMKTTLRNVSSNQSSTRIIREIRSLRSIASKDDPAKRVHGLIYEGRVLGVPFFVTPLMDANLEKCREEMGGTFLLPSVFFISQEILMGIKDCHKKNIVHRDIKPTNIVLNPVNRNQWFLIDFGEAVTNRKTLQLGPPDGFTLAYLSREAHDILAGKNNASTFAQDIESWFYILVDLIKPLEWKVQTNLEESKTAKKKFWEDIESSLRDYPPVVLQIGKLLKFGKLQYPYANVTEFLANGFNLAKSTMPDWKPDWIDRAKTREQREKEKQKVVAVPSVRGTPRSVYGEPKDEEKVKTPVTPGASMVSPTQNVSARKSVMAPPIATPANNPAPALTKQPSSNNLQESSQHDENANAKKMASGRKIRKDSKEMVEGNLEKKNGEVVNSNRKKKGSLEMVEAKLERRVDVKSKKKKKESPLQMNRSVYLEAESPPRKGKAPKPRKR